MADTDTDNGYQPERGRSDVWLAMIDEYLASFKDWRDTCDKIGREYADLNVLRGTVRDRKFSLLWSTAEVVKPSIYSRPPEPVVVPRFKDRRPLYRTASEVLERSVKVEFDLQSINDAMLLLRDDLVLFGRGVPWVRYDSSDGDKACFEVVYRDDFAHEMARNWTEVGWVARRAWICPDDFKERWGLDAYLSACTKVNRDAIDVAGGTREPKVPVWEIWSKTENKVVWVTDGVDETLEESEPHLKLQGFFPCPRPAFGTLEPGGLMPVPDYLMYKDQAEEVNAITNRIMALAQAVKVRGFYSSGSGEASKALEHAIQMNDDNLILIGIANLASLSSAGGGDMVSWFPIDEIAKTIGALIEYRRQLLDDVYQIVGIADIMRGSTDATETATAQRLKAQAGSIRIRDKQNELVRVARDMVAITAEIIAENFDRETIFEMAQTETPRDADIKRRVKEIEQQARQIADQAQQQGAQIMQQAQQAQDPEAQQQAQQQLEQLGQQADRQIQALMMQAEKVSQTVTQEQIMKFFRDQRIRPFVLDVESDSTIQADEDAEKQRRAEFLQAMGGVIGQFAPLLQDRPELTPFFGEVLKFAVAPYRAGRDLDNAIDETLEQMQQRDPSDNPEAEAARAQAETEQRKAGLEEQRMQLDAQKFQAEQQGAQEDRQLKVMEIQSKQQTEAQKMELERLKIQADLQIKQLDAENKRMEGKIKLQDAQMRQSEAQVNMQRDEQRFAMDIAQGEQTIQQNAQKAQDQRVNAQASAAAKMQRSQNQGGIGNV